MKETKVTINVRLGVLLTIIFMVLKLTKVIDWSWLWILSPIPIQVVLTILFFILYLLLRKEQ